MEKHDLNIIFAEDERTVRESLNRILNSIFTNVKSFENGQEAFEYYEKNGADIIITDINMPKMSGFELIKKSKLINEELPVVVVTAFSDVDNLKTALELQVDKLLSKPVNIDSLFDSLDKIRNILEMKKQLEKEKLKLENFKNAVESSDLVVIVDNQFNILNYNKLAMQQFNLQTNNNIEIINEQMKKEIILKSLKMNSFETVLEDKKNKKFYSVSSVPTDFKIENNTVLELYEMTLLFRDITDTIRQKDELIQALYTDSLTLLPNRASLLKNLKKEKNTNHSIIIIDVNSFSDINSFYGIKSGDMILKKLAQNIQEFYNSRNFKVCIYKLDSDKFAILIKHETLDKKERSLATEFCNELIDYLEECEYPINKDDTIHILLTIGRSFSEYDDLISEALLSLEYAKAKNIKNICYMDYEKNILKYHDHLKMQTILKKALIEDKIVPFFQPIVNINKEVMKYEALVRIVTENRTYTPYHFLEVAKKGVLYNQITKTMIKKVFEIFSQNNYKVSINLSLMDIVNPEILDYIKMKFDEYPNMKYKVTFELLESESFDDIEKTNEVCNYLKSLGADIAIDDFGSGYSNFSYFADLNMDIIKIDASLTKKATTVNGRIIIKNIINLAKELNCETVIEFVENEELFGHLKSLNIDMFQGYYFAKPMPWEEIKNFNQ